MIAACVLCNSDITLTFQYRRDDNRQKAPYVDGHIEDGKECFLLSYLR